MNSNKWTCGHTTNQYIVQVHVSNLDNNSSSYPCQTRYAIFLSPPKHSTPTLIYPQHCRDDRGFTCNECLEYSNDTNIFDGTSLFNKVYNYVPHRAQYKIFRTIKLLMTQVILTLALQKLDVAQNNYTNCCIHTCACTHVPCVSMCSYNSESIAWSVLTTNSKCYDSREVICEEIL